MDEIDRNLALISRALDRRRSAQNVSEAMQTKSLETEPQSIPLEGPATASVPNQVHFLDNLAQPDRLQLPEMGLSPKQVEFTENIPQPNQSSGIGMGARVKAELVDHQQIQTEVSVVSREIQEADSMSRLGSGDKGTFIPKPNQDSAPVSRSLWSRLRAAFRFRK